MMPHQRKIFNFGNLSANKRLPPLTSLRRAPLVCYRGVNVIVHAVNFDLVSQFVGSTLRVLLEHEEARLPAKVLSFPNFFVKGC